MRRKLPWLLGLLAVILWRFTCLSAAQEKAPPKIPPAAAPAPPAEKAPAPTPDPKQVLQQMCDFLKNQPQFSFKAEVTDDRVYAGGRKLQR